MPYDVSGPTACRVCGELRIRVRSERLRTEKKYRYRDERGREWSKRCCPDCVRIERNNREWRKGTRRPRVPAKPRVLKGRRLSPCGDVVCRDCREVKTRIRAPGGSPGYPVFVDDAGSRWYRRRCPGCAKKYHRKLSGSRERSALLDHRNRIGFLAESSVKAHFERQGWAVAQSSAHGPDLIIEKGTERFTCEVKAVCKYFVDGQGPFYFATPVYPNRRNDDIIALVITNDIIHIETMTDHLSKCTPSGRRTLTDLVRSYFPAA